MPESREDRKQGCNNPAGSPSLPIPNYLFMFNHYLKTILRNLWKGRVFTVINMTGLSAGLTCCMLILLYNRMKQVMTGSIKNSNDIYRITATQPVQMGR